MDRPARRPPARAALVARPLGARFAVGPVAVRGAARLHCYAAAACPVYICSGCRLQDGLHRVTLPRGFGFNAWGFVKKGLEVTIELRERGLETLTVWMYKEEDEPNVPRRGSRKRASAKFSPP